MFNSYIIEVGSEPAGIIVRDGRGFLLRVGQALLRARRAVLWNAPRCTDRSAAQGRIVRRKVTPKGSIRPGGRPPLISANEGREA